MKLPPPPCLILLSSQFLSRNGKLNVTEKFPGKYEFTREGKRDYVAVPNGRPRILLLFLGLMMIFSPKHVFYFN